MLRGVVQGVGFRPYVHALAIRHHLGGFVRNRSDGVLIEVEGPAPDLDAFTESLAVELPPLARIEDMRCAELTIRGEAEFRIESSDEPSGSSTDRFFSPDVATCDHCLRELLDPADRRHRHPFINCTSCGPRLTIIRDAPYDRERTTMASFAMCHACRTEYEDPADRRFHAQPIACPSCGPRLLALDGVGAPLARAPLPFAAEALRSGRVLAVKGVGGYHLACDATNGEAVATLRRRKHRDEKPFAVLVADLDAARRLCHVSRAEADLLASPNRPIVLLQRLVSAAVAEGVAPKNPLLGLMLPYTPLHHLLTQACGGRPLVLTSGNRSDEPIAFEDADAVQRLRGVADAFLSHDRPIHLRCDDSVARVTGQGPALLRRSRGYAPAPIPLSHPCPKNVLALGGHLKNTFALGRGSRAFLSHHLGDLGDYGAYRSFREAVAHYEALFAFETEVLVHDLHPGYATTEYARERSNDDVQLVAVQHHHAHMASCMAEHGLTGPVIGVTFDGTGYGLDGSLWGGEFLVGDYRSVRRGAHLRAVPLPGGERGVREPWRMALSHLADCGEEPGRCLRGVPEDAIRVTRTMVDRRINSPLTSSVGRLFDAVAALLGLRGRASFEGQAAMELEWLATTSDAEGVYPFDLTRSGLDSEGRLEIDTRPLVRAIASGVQQGDPPARVARRFHRTLAEIVCAVASRMRQETGLGDAVLSGGVFQNALLLEETTRKLERAGFRVHSQSRVPSNDGGLCLGQLAVAAARISGGA